MTKIAQKITRNERRNRILIVGCFHEILTTESEFDTFPHCNSIHNIHFSLQDRDRQGLGDRPNECMMNDDIDIIGE